MTLKLGCHYSPPVKLELASCLLFLRLKSLFLRFVSLFLRFVSLFLFLFFLIDFDLQFFLPIRGVARRSSMTRTGRCHRRWSRWSHRAWCAWLLVQGRGAGKCIGRRIGSCRSCNIRSHVSLVRSGDLLIQQAVFWVDG